MSDVRKTSSAGGPRGVIYDFNRARVSAPAAEPAFADRAGFSEDARELSRAQSAVENSADVRTARVKALKAQIARGEYRPDPREVARRIIERGL